ncbi:MAG TPA: LysM peptidoglycan-binding domain-containing protein, partial [Candidatus Saccharimonadales bacterium]|nr:LysM peptidoglycan-binding domain-containing protein [Candidatus Saccharimonadales bacterium]
MPQLEGAGVPRLSLRQTKLDKRTKKKLVRRGIMFGNILLLVLVAAFVVYNRSASQTVRASTLSSATSTASDKTDPLDQLSSSQIALTAAQMTNLPELPAIKNTADSDTLLLSVVPNDSTALSKPQIVATAEKSRTDIVHYTVKKGDTVTSLSKQFHVSAGDIRWSNSISGDTLTAGLHLVIPPINGIVYKVKAGDTPAKLAA